MLLGRAVMGDGADEEEAHNRCRHGRDSRQVEGGRPRAYQDEELPGLVGYGECVVSTAPSLLADLWPPCVLFSLGSKDSGSRRGVSHLGFGGGLGRPMEDW